MQGMSTEEQQETEFEKKLRAKAAAEEEEESSAEPESEESDEPVAKSDTSDEDAGEYEDVAAGLEAECESLRDQLLRARAEFDNYRKRTAREVERIRKTASESVIHDLLPVLDNLELALHHVEHADNPLAEGVKMVLKQMLETLERNGLEPIEAMGQPFDPNLHEALSQMPSAEVPKDNVAEEYQRGYKIGGQVIRPSKVVVSLGAEE